MSVSDFVKGLPCHDSNNFTHFNTEQRISQKRPSVYLPTEDVAEPEQLIVMEKRCVLLRYLTQQWDKKSHTRKREAENNPPGGGNNSSNCKKRPRLDPVE